MMAILRALVCAALSGVCFYLSNGLGEVWYLAWIAALPILWLAYGNQPRITVAGAAFLAYFIGQTNIVIGYWGDLPTITLIIALFVPPVVFAVAVLFGRFVARRSGVFAGVIAFPALWTAIDYLIGVTAPDGTAGSFAYSQAGVPEMMQGASLFGLWIITFLLMLNSSLLAMALWRPAHSRLLAGLALVIFGANVMFGVYRLNAEATGETVHVALVANDALYRQSVSNDGVTALAVIQNYITASQTAIKNGAQVIVFPEKIAIIEPAWRQDALQLLRDAADTSKVTFIAGFDMRGETRRNAALVFEAGKAPYEYDKRRMVPGLEDVFRPGLSSGVFEAGRATVVCKDMDFADMIRKDSQAHIRVMFVPAWDFGADGWAHARMAIMRGVENGFAIARSARDGYVTATTATGHLIAGSPTTRLGFVSASANLPLGPGETLYLRIGDAFAWLSIALALVVGALAFMRGRETRADAGDDTAQKAAQ